MMFPFLLSVRCSRSKFLSKIINFFVKNFGKYFRFIFYKLNASITDSGWKTTIGVCKYRKKNGIVEIIGYSPEQPISTDYNTLFILSEGFRPTEIIWFPEINARYVSMTVQIKPNGDVSIRAMQNTNGFIINLTFIAS